MSIDQHNIVHKILFFLQRCCKQKLLSEFHLVTVCRCAEASKFLFNVHFVYQISIKKQK